MPKAPIVAIVEDDEAVREALSDLLSVLNLPHRAFDAAEAFLAAYAPGQFDCLITDVRMPGVGGLELQERLRAAGSTMPVIIMTSATDQLVETRALESGAHAVLAKPVDENVLIRYLKSALNWQAPYDGVEERESRNG